MIARTFSFMRARLHVALVVLLLSAVAGTVQACPDDGGPTCSASTPAPASQPATASVNIGAGNPINILTGNKYQREQDMAPLPGVLGLEIVRHYNSRFSGTSDMPGLLGRGWKLSYETILVANGNMLQVFQADGSSFMFYRDLANPALANGADPASGSISIRRNRQGGDDYIWLWGDGRELRFDQQGKLQQIKAITGEVLSLLYDSKGLLVKVTDPQGRSLRLIYPERGAARGGRFLGVKSIDSPMGRFDYEQGSSRSLATTADPRQLVANLVRVHYPVAGQGREYFYEDARRPTLLTGIGILRGAVHGADPAKQAQPAYRYATYAYDSAGRGVLSTHANDAGKVTISYDKPGQTTVTNSLGQPTVYRYATVGEDLRLLEARGPGCAQCGPGNTRYAYDRLGRLTETTRTDGAGGAVSTVRNELDHYGRPLSVYRIDYRNGQALPPQLQVRYEYGPGATPKPTAVIRPSVVVGKQTRTRIAYNDRLQVVSINEQGWAPPMEAGGAALPLARTTVFSYRNIAGRSLLAMVDGPLRNGPRGQPVDSDVTTYEYDQSGNHVMQTTLPGNRIMRIAQINDAGRPLRLVDANGVVLDYGYDELGRVTKLGKSGVHSYFSYNTLGQVSEVLQATGQRMQFTYGGDGRLSDVTDAQGNRIKVQRDGEGNLLARELLNPDGSVAQSSDLSRYTDDPEAPANQFDTRGGSERLVDPHGGVTTVERNADGLPLSVMEPGGITTRLAYDNLHRVTQISDPRALRTGYVYDDFGRLLRVDSPDAGVTVYRWNDDDTLRAKTLAYGSERAQTITYRYDLAGHVVEQRTAEGVTRLDYGPQGKPVRVTFPGGEELYEYAAGGQLTLHTRIFDGARLSTRYVYDGRGQLTRKTLPDGEILDYRYHNALHPKAGLLAGITRKRLLADTVLLNSMNDAEDGYARQQYQLAHGVDFVRHLDRKGRVTRIGSPGFWEENQRVDAVGQIVQRGSSGLEGIRHTRYGYGPLGRLEAATESDGNGRHLPGALSYDYDVAGNLVQRSGTTAARYQIDALSNRILSADGSGARREYQYDAAGRTTRAGATTYNWDSQGRLTKVSQDGQPVAEYRYNAFGERIKKVVYTHNQKKVTYFLYDGSQLVAEAEPDVGGIAIKRQYVWLEDHNGTRPIALLQARDSGVRAAAGAALKQVPAELTRAVGQAERTDVFAIVADHTGAARALVDAARQIIWSASIRGYGRAQVGAGSALAFQLRGSEQYFDEESGLHYNTQRYLDADSGRYLSPDPSGQAGGINLYAYANGNPVANIDPLGLQSKPAGPVSGWSFADKLVYVVGAAIPKLPAELGAVLKDMVSPEKIATTAAIFALWAGSHAFGVGAIFDGVMLGVAYYTMGRAAIDVMMGLIDTTIKINNAKCEGDLQAAAGILSHALSVGAGGFVEGALLRKIFSKTEGDLGASVLEQIKKGVNYGKNKFLNATSTLAKLGFRSRSWANIVDRVERGFVGELDAWSFLISGKKKLQIMGNKTLDPAAIRNQADYDAQLAGYKGAKGMDGAFEERPGFFKAIIGGKPMYYLVESKATAGVFPANPTKSILDTTRNGGGRQMSETWLNSNGSKRITDSVGSAGLADIRAAAGDGRVKKVLALTDRNGTRYFEINDVPNQPGEVSIGADITSLFK